MKREQQQQQENQQRHFSNNSFCSNKQFAFFKAAYAIEFFGCSVHVTFNRLIKKKPNIKYRHKRNEESNAYWHRNAATLHNKMQCTIKTAHNKSFDCD